MRAARRRVATSPERGGVTRCVVTLAGAALSLGACSAVLDFDDECALDADCDALGRGLRCDDGFCVPRDLIETGGCERDADCSTYGVGTTCVERRCVDSQQVPIGGLCDRFFGQDPRTSPAGTVITLGALLPRSGPLGAFGDGMENGVRLAVQEINQSGGVLGMKLGVVSCDDGTDADKAVRAARHLVDVAKVDAIIGAGASGVTIEAFNKVAKDARVLMMSPSATSPAISNLPDGGLLWRTAPSDAVQGRAIARYIVAKGYDKIGIVNRNDAYGNGLAATIQGTLCDGGFVCNSDTLLNRTYTDQGGQAQVDEQATAVADFAAFGPDAIVLIGYVQDGIDLLNIANGSGFRFILTDGMRDTALLGTSANQVGVADPNLLCTIVGTFPASPSGELFDAFAFAYEGQFTTPPATFSANAYDAAYLIALAYAAAQGGNVGDPDGRALAEGLTRLSRGSPIALGMSAFGTALTELSSDASTTVDVTGVSGPLDFDAALGEAPSGIEMWRLDPSRQQISNLGVVYDGQNEYNFDAVLQAEPAPTCVMKPGRASAEVTRSEARGDAAHQSPIRT